MSKQIEEFRMRLHHETEPGKSSMGAVLVSETGDKDDAIWLPKSQIEFEEVKGKTGFLDIQIPVWLAEDKGLI